MTPQIVISEGAIIGVSVTMLGLIAGIAGTWAVMRHRLGEVEAELADMLKRLTKIEAWREREIGARSAAPHPRDWPTTAPIDIVQPRRSEDSTP